MTFDNQSNPRRTAVNRSRIAVVTTASLIRLVRSNISIGTANKATGSICHILLTCTDYLDRFARNGGFLFFIHPRIVEKKTEAYGNKKESHKDTYMIYRIRRKGGGKQS